LRLSAIEWAESRALIAELERASAQKKRVPEWGFSTV
jgi:hypothetical protein